MQSGKVQKKNFFLNLRARLTRTHGGGSVRQWRRAALEARATRVAVTVARDNPLCAGGGSGRRPAAEIQ